MGEGLGRGGGLRKVYGGGRAKEPVRSPLRRFSYGSGVERGEGWKQEYITVAVQNYLAHGTRGRMATRDRKAHRILIPFTSPLL